MMPWMKWLPWRFIVRYIARAHGFLDPLPVLASLRRFAEPSEVAEPLELLRAGVVFHARGLINSRVIQHNLDWIWPYWIEEQFNPYSNAFVPRAFSLTHVNLTYRNWTAVGHPDCFHMPVVDPRGLLTPHYDGWSVDAAIVTDDGENLIPSRQTEVAQHLDTIDGLAVVTRCTAQGMQLLNQASVRVSDGEPESVSVIEARSDRDGWLMILLRPYNPEGVSFIHEAGLSRDRRRWVVDDKFDVRFSEPAERHHLSEYRAGDVYTHYNELEDTIHGICSVGLVTAAALYRVRAGVPRRMEVVVPLALGDIGAEQGSSIGNENFQNLSWSQELQGRCQLSVPDPLYQTLYDAALRTLVLLSPEDVFPGPYTYKRFWFRDAAYMVNALLCTGFVERAERALNCFPGRQALDGYFHSQQGEWDANGEVLWIMERFCRLTGRRPTDGWHTAIKRGARWICRKRRANPKKSALYGLLPAGFSAEHLGLNDYYYWDNFWGIAGLRSASRLCGQTGYPELEKEFEEEADAYQSVVDESLAQAERRLGRPAMPAAPSRRLDPGAIGCVVAGYPLQLYDSNDPRLMDTADYLIDNCFVGGGFFQDMVHSGINAYLTLHVAQLLLRAGDGRYFGLMQSVAEMASPTGQWPEAIHPRTGGGCMGDGQHGWAAAEWAIMIRECFVREKHNGLILASGIARRWLETDELIHFGPAPTPYGAVTVTITTVEQDSATVRVAWRGEWFDAAPEIDVRLPGYAPVIAEPQQNQVEIKLNKPGND